VFVFLTSDGNCLNLPEQHGRSWRLVKGHRSLGKVTEPCGAWWRMKETRRRSYDMSGRNLGRK